MPHWIKEFDLDVEHVFVCHREFEANLRSMFRLKYRKKTYKGLSRKEIYERLAQEIPLAYGRLYQNLIELNLPYTPVVFPKLCFDLDYCFNVFSPFINTYPKDRFETIWKEVVQTDKASKKRNLTKDELYLVGK